MIFLSSLVLCLSSCLKNPKTSFQKELVQSFQDIVIQEKLNLTNNQLNHENNIFYLNDKNEIENSLIYTLERIPHTTIVRLTFPRFVYEENKIDNFNYKIMYTIDGDDKTADLVSNLPVNVIEHEFNNIEPNTKLAITIIVEDAEGSIFEHDPITLDESMNLMQRRKGSRLKRRTNGRNRRGRKRSTK